MDASMAKAITKTTDLAAESQKVFKFLSNPFNWPQFAVINLVSVDKEQDGWYFTVSKNGPGQIKMLTNEAHGILDHIWKDPQATWKVFMRVVPNGSGSTLTTTFFKPPQINEADFQKGMRDMDIEFAKLQAILEHP
jgi:hypothetical protein